MKISVLTPNYNHGRYLRDNFEGLLAQTYQNWEMIVVDDCSIDNSAEIIRNYADRDKRIKPIFLPQNVGCIGAFQIALQAAEGDLVYGSAADDFICNPDFFQYAVDALTNFNAAGFYGVTLSMDENTMQPISKMGFAPYSGYINPQAAMEAFLKGIIFIPGSSVILKKNLFEKHGGFNKELGPQTDYFINHALAALYGAVFRYEVMSTFRVSQQSYGNSAKDDEYFKHHALVEKKVRELPVNYSISEKLYNKWRHRIIHKRLLDNKNIEIAYKIFDEYTGKILAPKFKKQLSGTKEFSKDKIDGNRNIKRNIRNKIFYLFYKLPIPIQKIISRNKTLLRIAETIGIA